MTYEIPGQRVTVLAAADFRSGQYRACTLNSSGQAAVPSAGAKIFGIVQNKPNTGEAATVVISGISKMEAGGVVAAGADVTTDASGRGVTAATGNTIAGNAVEAAGASGVYFPVRIDRGAIAP